MATRYFQEELRLVCLLEGFALLLNCVRDARQETLITKCHCGESSTSGIVIGSALSNYALLWEDMSHEHSDADSQLHGNISKHGAPRFMTIRRSLYVAPHRNCCKRYCKTNCLFTKAAKALSITIPPRTMMHFSITSG